MINEAELKAIQTGKLYPWEVFFGYLLQLQQSLVAGLVQYLDSLFSLVVHWFLV